MLGATKCLSPLKTNEVSAEDDSAAKTDWVGVSWIMLADVVGTSILALGYVAAQLGWILTVGLLVAALGLAVYTAILMSQTHTTLLEHLGLSVSSMGEAARYTLGGDTAAAVIFLVVYGYAFLGNATYLLVLGTSFQGAYCGTTTCEALSTQAAVVVAAVLCAPVICALRKIGESTTLCFINLIMILLVLVIVIGSIVHQGRKSSVESPLFVQTLQFESFFGASTNILYSYAGHWLYFELMDTMKQPADFPKVFQINAPLQGVLYVGAACVSFYFIGTSADTDGLQCQVGNVFLYRSMQALLFIHVAIVFLIKSVVLTRFLEVQILPDIDENEHKVRDWSVHILCSIVLLVLSCTLALVVPFFTLFLGLVGGLFAASISYTFPVLFYCGAKGRYVEERPASVNDPPIVPEFSCAKLFKALKMHEYLLFTILMVISVFVTSVGTYNQIQLIQEANVALSS